MLNNKAIELQFILQTVIDKPDNVIMLSETSGF